MFPMLRRQMLLPGPRTCQRIALWMRRRAVNDNGNDNGKSDQPAAHPSPDPVLDAAVRQFARHGSAAGQIARDRAKSAFFAGERDNYRFWLAVCRTLDRRLVEELERMDRRPRRHSAAAAPAGPVAPNEALA